MFTIDLEIKKKELDKINKLGSFMRLGLLKGVKKSMYFAEGQAKKNFGGPGQLRIRSGHLRRSIKSKVLDRGGGREIIGVVGSDVIYAAIHEFGGPHPRSKTGKKMPARPFIGPAFDKGNMIRMRRIIQKEIAGEVRRRS
jgi:phage gpG-like protein